MESFIVSGARTPISRLGRAGATRGSAILCVGVGQGTALLERV